jgi:nucleoside 2-deoxyribosyltransferase
VKVSSPHDSTNRQMLSAICRYHAERGEPLLITADVLDDYLVLAPPRSTPLEALDELLIYIGEKQPGLSDWALLTNDRFPIQVTRNTKDYEFLKRVLVEKKLVESHDDSYEHVRLSIDGWARYHDLRSTRSDSHQAFVAMWFADELTPAWTQGIRPGLEDAGYTAVRLDAVEHNEKIDDRIIAEIRRSGLVVADLTGGRANVYFEAGFAMGLGVPVIWTCREDHLDDLHFDTRQYNYIGWTTPAELRERLRLRIEATLPRKADARR